MDPEGFTNSDAPRQKSRLPGKDCASTRIRCQSSTRSFHLPPSKRRVVGQGGGGLRGGRGSGLRLDPARGQVHRLSRSSHRARRVLETTATHRRPRQVAAKQRRPRSWSDSRAHPHPTIKPLQGVRVIDASSFLAGPFCCHAAGRVRRRGHQDRAAEGRRCPAHVRHHHEQRRLRLPGLQECRNKKAATLTSGNRKAPRS